MDQPYSDYPHTRELRLATSGRRTFNLNMVSVTPVMERNIRADRVLHTDHNQLWVYNYEFRKTNKLTLYDEHFVERKSLILTDHLYDMALSASQDIITTNYNDRVVKISPTGSVSTLCSTAPLHPRGICINNRQQVVVGLETGFGRPPYKLAIYSAGGSIVLQEIENDEDDRPLFRRCITQVKQNRNGDYVVAERNRILCVSSQGRFRWDYSAGISFVFGMVCDKYDNVIIAEHYYKIHLLSSERKLLTTLLTHEDGLRNPRSLSIDRHGQLWIGQDNGPLKVVKLPCMNLLNVKMTTHKSDTITFIYLFVLK